MKHAPYETKSDAANWKARFAASAFSKLSISQRATQEPSRLGHPLRKNIPAGGIYSVTNTQVQKLKFC
ncbi:hypothetical protein [Cypionkella psychrotolerans]|uniref:hypothetical protein n=1 Tax=Cypionkella psychrotolerans TaxID=1678131 RepID=UPI000A79E965|nr:hypothetical protein [Cypionkella psychrotolerans]